jgi:ABC-type Na+ efflux pump permease subunit
MYQILTFAWKQVHRVYSDKGLLIFMLLTPLAIATIIGLAFGGQSGTLVIRDIPLAVVNLDTGAGNSQLGATVASILLSQPIEGEGGDRTCSLVTASANATMPQSLDDLFEATALSDAAAARAGVSDGTYVAAVIIPENFSAALSPETNFASIGDDSTALTIEPVTIEIYASAGSPILAGVVRSVSESIVNQTVRGSIVINATISSLLANPINIPRLSFASEADFEDFSCAFSSELETIRLERLPVNETQEQSPFVQILVQMGAAQAVFFAIFTMNNSLLSIYNDKKTWILQRLLVTPTPRINIIIGKILGAMLLVLLQVALLLVALTLVASFVMGEALFIWGNNIPLLFLLTLVLGFAVGGLGVFVIGIAKSPAQANIFGSLAAMGMAILGGSFGFSVGDAEKLSIIYWGRSAYSALSAGNNDIGLNLLILLLVGSILFAIGVWFFNKRVEV